MRLSLLAFLVGLVLVPFATVAGARSANAVTGGPQGAYPYLLKGSSPKQLVSSRAADPWAITHHGNTGSDTLRIIAFKVEFQPDASELTTGNGLFGIALGDSATKSDLKEWEYYTSGVYRYDNVVQDTDYFTHQLEFVRHYFATVSRNRLHIDFEIFPDTGRGSAYRVPHRMANPYSPGAKKPEESWDDYYYRRTEGLMKFVRDAILAADTSQQAEKRSPFEGLRVDSTRPGENVFIDENGTRTAFLIIHAGASYLTDGGTQYLGQDSPSDMIDAFISPDFFEYFADSLGFDTMNVDGSSRTGVSVRNDKLLIDEIMMVSETSNQDSLNWGIHGILVNQVARQLGIPDLFSTMSGISGVGGFCIMDFAGYSAGRGFIPPWPSAWVRAFMGWDRPIVVDPSNADSYTLTAVSEAQPGDTTILLVPINDHEYYLVENRQRNLWDTSRFPEAFNYDTIDQTDTVIDPYDPVNLDANVESTLGEVIYEVKNFDVSLPASGVLVWHVDEDRIRSRLQWNVLNADSLYRAVSLEEADGVQDLGIEFSDAFYQASFDYGGAADVFPHLVDTTPRMRVTGMGPFTRPSTQSNDGGHSYLDIEVGTSKDAREELSLVRETVVINYADTTFSIKVSYAPPTPEAHTWDQPRKLLPGEYFDPVLCDVYENDRNGKTVREVAVVDDEGRLYLWPLRSDGSLAPQSLGSLSDSLAVVDLRKDTVYTATQDTETDESGVSPLRRGITYFARLESPVAMPTAVGADLFIPASDGLIVVSKGTDGNPSSHTITLPAAASSYVCNYSADRWAVGCADGRIVFGRDTTVTSVSQPAKGRDEPVQALAVLDSATGTVAAIDARGGLTVYRGGNEKPLRIARAKGGIGPFSLAAGDLNRRDTLTTPQIVVCDSRQGLWLFDSSPLRAADGWLDSLPNDWGSIYHYRENPDDTSRLLLPRNLSAPALADLNADGALDIVVGGTNGIYAFDYRGSLLTNAWPSYLDNRYWYQRGSVRFSPIVGSDSDGDPLVVFGAPSGEHATIAVADIDSALVDEGKIYYTRENGLLDSITELDSSFIDTLLIFGDSLILPYILPGGFVDARTSEGKRPSWVKELHNVGDVRQSYWPLTMGSPAGSAPMLGDMDSDGETELLSVSERGWLYRWELSEEMLAQPFFWPQTGFNGSRTFAYQGPAPAVEKRGATGIREFFSYPNPVVKTEAVDFKYGFSATATDVRLDIFTYTGYHVYSRSGLPGAFPAMNEHRVFLERFGPAVYRCRLEAKVGGKRYTRYWKMAVVK